MSRRRVDEAIREALGTLERVAQEYRGAHRYDDMRAVEEAANELRRTRFHEKEIHDHWLSLDLINTELGVRPWKPDHGDTRCQICWRPNPVWFADNAIWNEVMRTTGEEDWTGIVCPTCFALKAPQVTWRLYVDRRTDDLGDECTSEHSPGSNPFCATRSVDAPFRPNPSRTA